MGLGQPAAVTVTSKLFDVPPGAFVPAPKVTSSIVRMVPRAAGEIPPVNEELFAQIVAAAFQQRRKTIRNALSRLMPPEAIEAAGISLGARPEVLSTADYVALTCEAARIVPPAQSS